MTHELEEPDRKEKLLLKMVEKFNERQDDDKTSPKCDDTENKLIRFIEERYSDEVLDEVGAKTELGHLSAQSHFATITEMLAEEMWTGTIKLTFEISAPGDALLTLELKGDTEWETTFGFDVAAAGTSYDAAFEFIGEVVSSSLAVDAAVQDDVFDTTISEIIVEISILGGLLHDIEIEKN